jgi:hypothetical protein
LWTILVLSACSNRSLSRTSVALCLSIYLDLSNFFSPQSHTLDGDAMLDV